MSGACHTAWGCTRVIPIFARGISDSVQNHQRIHGHRHWETERLMHHEWTPHSRAGRRQKSIGRHGIALAVHSSHTHGDVTGITFQTNKSVEAAMDKNCISKYRNIKLLIWGQAYAKTGFEVWRTRPSLKPSIVVEVAANQWQDWRLEPCRPRLSI